MILGPIGLRPLAGQGDDGVAGQRMSLEELLLTDPSSIEVVPPREFVQSLAIVGDTYEDSAIGNSDGDDEEKSDRPSPPTASGDNDGNEGVDTSDRPPPLIDMLGQLTLGRGYRQETLEELEETGDNDYSSFEGRQWSHSRCL